MVCPVPLVSQRLGSGGTTSASWGGTHLICVKEGGVGCGVSLWTSTLRGSGNLDARLTVSSREQKSPNGGQEKQIKHDFYHSDSQRATEESC